MKAARVRDSRRASRRCAPSARRLPPARRASPGAARRARARPSTGSCSATRRSTVPLVLSGGLTPDNVAEAIRGDAPVRGRHRERHRGVARASRTRPRSRRSSAPSSRRGWRPRERSAESLRAPLRPLRRPLRARDADPGARRARGGVARGARRPRLRARRSSGCCATTPGARRRSTSPSGSRSECGRDGLPQARGPASTRARTRSTTRSARRCSPSGWASRASSPRPARASTASRPRPPARCSASSAIVYMGTEDMRRQQPNVERMRLLGAEVVPRRGGRADAEGGGAARRSATGSRTSHTTHYVIGSAVGPAPYPALVRDLQRVIGDEARAQVLEADGPAARPRDRVRRRRLERDRHVHRVPRRRRRRADRRRGRGRGHRHRPPRRAAHGRRARASCTAPTRRCCRTTTARSSRRTRSRPGSTTRARAPSTPGCATRAARSTSP